MSSPYTDPGNLGRALDPPDKGMISDHSSFGSFKLRKPTPLTSANVVPLHKGRGDAYRPHQNGSLQASAKKITSGKIPRSGVTADWQNDAWEMFEMVGEERFLSTTLAGRMGQAKFYIGERPGASGGPPARSDNKQAQEILESLGNSAANLAQMIYRLGVNLFVVGEGWLAGIPKKLLEEEEEEETSSNSFGMPTSITPDEPNETLNLDDLEWRVFSNDEVSVNNAGETVLYVGDTEKGYVRDTDDQITLIRIWRPHPRKWWEADSPTRSSLPVLRELVGLTMHISAQVDSRLAGAGLLIVPQSAKRSFNEAIGSKDPDDDPFTDALMEAMITPIEDRSSASAVVPMVVAVPDESADKFQHITFSSTLDSEARSLRDEAIKRLALGQDAPPELLLGTGNMNHWGAWLVREDTVTTHVEPPLALICDALTSQFLWPLLSETGMSDEEVRKYVIWYDVEHMIVRPNRSDSAMKLYNSGVLSDDALRDSSGFSEEDAPSASGMDEAVSKALGMVESSPTILQVMTLEQLVNSIRSVMGENVPEGSTQPEPDNKGEDEGSRPNGSTERDNRSPESGSGPGSAPAQGGGGEEPTQ